MNETLRKRMIGLAVILIALFGLSFFIPPRHRSPTESHSIPVRVVPAGPTSAATVVPPPQSAAAPAGGGSAVIGGRPAGRSTSAPPPVTASTAKQAATKPAGVAKRKRTSIPPSSAWWVQVASFSKPASADQVLASFRRSGIPGTVESAAVGGRTYYRVRLGPFRNRSDADVARRHAADRGYTHSRTIAPG